MPVVVTGLVAVLAFGTWTVVTVGAGDPCEQPVTVRVAATPEIAPVVGGVAEGITGACARFEVSNREGVQTAEALAVSDGGLAPHVWIPESTLLLRRARGAGADGVPETGPSVATSPVVLGLTEDAAGTLGWPARVPAWRDVLAPGRGLTVGLPDPARDPVGVSALLGVRDTARNPAEFTAALRALSPNTVAGSADLFSLLPGLSGAQAAAKGVTVVPTSENALLRHNVRSPGAPLVAAYSAAIPALDYPLVVLAHAGQAETRAAAALRDALRGERGRAALADAGFRTPDGRMQRDRSGDRRTESKTIPLPALPPAEEIDRLLNQWSRVHLTARAQVLIDVSGSMNAIVGDTGRTRMQVTREAAQRALDLFKPATDLRVLAFSTRLDGDRDFREVLPMAPVGKHRASGAADRLGALEATPNGQTGLYDSVLAAYQVARREWEPGRLNLVIVMTDGRNEDPASIARADLLAELTRLRDPRRPLPVIGIGLGPDIDVAELTEISRATGGQAFTTADPARIGEVFFAALNAMSG
ncbi:VWA domain-containing protein [Amycolatopsis suaedae]|uniref:VWA domain-containing protein n=1 Tax=Amycolatopsis suaedae TaxID=2510978 RepID=A0A4Q7IY52_9PSEU|nr:VWA domain-containing protein [Amycolatopsis suaedae]